LNVNDQVKGSDDKTVVSQLMINRFGVNKEYYKKMNDGLAIKE